MKQKKKQVLENRTLLNGIVRWPGITAVLVLIAVMAAPTVLAADGIDPEADKLLKSMSTFLGGLNAFSAKADIDSEIIDLDGQKLQFSSSGEIIMKRPGHLYMHRQGAIADIKLIYDGKILTLQGLNLNVYFQKDVAGTIDTAIDTLRNEVGLDAPGADLFYSDVYEGLVEGVVSSAYLGTAFVNGAACHHLSFREARTDWQLWIRAEGDPLPIKYVITSKWMTGAPQYAVRFRYWDTSPKIDPGQFEFKAPEGVTKLETVHADEIGQLVVEEGE